jgi:hypothetical protein
MIIIGLLIGGVLKGQELIGNAQVSSTVTQVKSIDAAVLTFFDMYNGYPGDIRTPANRLQNCTTTPCSATGNGDSKLTAPFSGVVNNNEAPNFFVHLSAAGLLTGINPQAGAAGQAFGADFPATAVGGGFRAGRVDTPTAAQAPGGNTPTTMTTGNYLALIPAAGLNGVSNTTVGLTANQAARIDIKLDDGVPAVGNVRGIGGATC